MSEDRSQTPAAHPAQANTGTGPVESSKSTFAKQQKLAQAKRLLLHNHKGMSVTELTELLGVSRRTTLRYLRELRAESLRAESDEQARHRLVPTAEDIELAQAVMQATHGFGVSRTEVSQNCDKPRTTESAEQPLWTTSAKIDDTLAALGRGRSDMDSVPYDTAWVARLAPHFRGYGFEQALTWLRKQQRVDGSWGGGILHYHDRVICTLASIVALRQAGHTTDWRRIKGSSSVE
jgi:predicted transcriptional regulator